MIRRLRFTFQALSLHNSGAFVAHSTGAGAGTNDKFVDETAQQYKEMQDEHLKRALPALLKSPSRASVPIAGQRRRILPLAALPVSLSTSLASLRCEGEPSVCGLCAQVGTNSLWASDGSVATRASHQHTATHTHTPTNVRGCGCIAAAALL